MNNLLKIAALGLGSWWVYRNFIQPRYSFNGRTVLITGGSRGLGLVMARQLAEQGASVAICARDAEELRLAREDLLQHGDQVFAVECDVTDQDRVRETVALVQRRFGPVDVLINNAGIIGVGPIETMTVADFEAAMRVHYWGSLFMILEVLPGMQQRKQGRIVNVSSIGGKIAVPHLLPYVGSKFALTGLSHGLRVELAKDGIVVTTICPGLMRTGSHINAEFKGQHEKEYAWFALGDSIPGLSTNAESAARSILDACARGDAELVLTLPAKLAVVMQTLMPGVTDGLAAWVNGWVLPDKGDGNQQLVPGRESRGLLPEWVTTLTDQASVENNETAAGRHSPVPPPLPARS